MLEEERVLYGLDDVCIVPAKRSTVSSRKQCDPYHYHTTPNKHLPIFVAPMSCLTNVDNIQSLARTRYDLGNSDIDSACINPVLSRGTDLETRIEYLKQGYWVAFGLNELPELIERAESIRKESRGLLKVCIDVANGHMQKLFEASRHLRYAFENHSCLEIMVGNIANPETFRDIVINGDVDYVRLGIGSGNVCTTSVQTGIHYPMASLISDCAKIAAEYNDVVGVPYIVADGGFNRIDQCVKALALGADYVMLGRIIAQSDEACGKLWTKDGDDFVPGSEAGAVGCNLYREYYGMSTQKAQREFNPDRSESELRHSEGLETKVKVKYKLDDWLKDFVHALKSSMSYTNCLDLEHFHRVKCMPMSKSDFNAYMYKEED